MVGAKELIRFGVTSRILSLEWGTYAPCSAREHRAVLGDRVSDRKNSVKKRFWTLRKCLRRILEVI